MVWKSRLQAGHIHPGQGTAGGHTANQNRDRRTLPPEGFTTREAAICWAREVMVDQESVFLDTETTGLDGAAEVVDIAVVASDGRVLLDTLVRPRCEIPAMASRIHGIRDEHVAQAPTWPEVAADLDVILSGRRVVVYNAPFDRRMISQCCMLHGVPIARSDWSCAMRAFAAFHGEANTQRSGYRWHKLELAVAQFGAQPGGHRALGDALACRAVVVGMATWEDDRP